MNKSDFIKICKMSQAALKTWLKTVLSAYYPNVIDEDGFLYAKGKEAVCLTAHLDTVHKEQVKKVKDSKGKLSSPQGIGGDDRCGVYMILSVLEKTDLRPTILFCEDEEVGGKGSQKFCKTKYINDLAKMIFIIELDRANAKDLVFYDDANNEFHEFCEKTTGYKESYGSFSDISNLCPVCEVSGVNISCGYYNAHTNSEYVVMSEMENSTNKVIDLINEGIKNGKTFKYEEDLFMKAYYGYGYKTEKRNRDILCMVVFYDYEGSEYVYDNQESPLSAIAQFLMDNPAMCWNDVMDYDIY